MDLPFVLVNVFALEGDPFSGNPLAVVEAPPEGLDPGVMQQVARQFNLSETTFVALGGPDAEPGAPDAAVRIFTPTIELPFAGHPTLGTAFVVAGRTGRDAARLRMPAGDIPVSRDAAGWILTANPATVRPAALSAAELAGMLGLAPGDLAGEAHWVESGVDQLLVPLRGVAGVQRAAPDAALLRRHAMSPRGEALCLVWARTGPGEVAARFFFSQGASVAEDPATGSAAANLAGLLAWQGHRGVAVTISQGAAVQRPSLLRAEVGPDGTVTVGGRVAPIGSGTLTLPDGLRGAGARPGAG